MNKVFHPFSRVIMLLSPFNFSLPGLDYLFVFEPRLGWIAANTISTQGGGGVVSRFTGNKCNLKARFLSASPLNRPHATISDL